MPPPNPAEKLLEAPLADLIVLLLKQFKRLLDERGLRLTTPELEEIGQQASVGVVVSDHAQQVRQITATLVAESEAELQSRFGFTFSESLATDMQTVGGWETTAEFIEVANVKSNAELRISAGSALRVFLGDPEGVLHLLTVIDHDSGAMDVDAAFARRALCHAAEVSPSANDWLKQVHQWWDDQQV